MAVRNEFLRRNARATHFGNLDLVPSASTLASRLLPSSPLKRPDDRPGNCARRIPVGRTKERQFHRVKYWETIADNLKKAGWNCDRISSTDHKGRQFWAWPQSVRMRGRPIVHADAALTAFYHAMSKRTRARRGVLRAKHVYRVGIPKLLRTAARITAKACSRYWGAAY